MPAGMKRISASGGGSVFLHTCEVCGADASFGAGVSLRLAMVKLAVRDIVSAKRNLGKWYCREHRPVAGELIG